MKVRTYACSFLKIIAGNDCRSENELNETYLVFPAKFPHTNEFIEAIKKGVTCRNELLLETCSAWKSRSSAGRGSVGDACYEVDLRVIVTVSRMEKYHQCQQIGM